MPGDNKVKGTIFGTVVQAHTIKGDLTIIRRGSTVALACVLSLVSSLVITASNDIPPRLLASAEFHTDCNPTHVAGEPTAVPEFVKPDGGLLWTELAGVRVTITLQNPSQREIVLNGMRIDVQNRREAPTTGFVMDACPCGALPVRRFEADLRPPHPRIKAVADEGARPVDFPYQVSAGDPEVIDLRVTDVAGYAEFSVVFDVAIGGQKDHVTVGGEDLPWRVVTANASVPWYSGCFGEELVRVEAEPPHRPITDRPR